MDENIQLKQEIAELKKRLERLERVFIITPTNMTINTNVRVPGTVHTDRVYRRGSTGNYTEVTT